jgi:exonuclease VII small subunit
MNLEQKLSHLKEIQELLASGAVPLSQSMTVLEEAATLKKAIETDLSAIENRLTELEATDSAT